MPPKRGKIRANADAAKTHGKIASKIETIRELNINFSLRYLDWDSEKFTFTDMQGNYFRTLLERVQEVSKMPLRDFVTQPNRTLRNHRIDFGDSGVTEPGFGIPLGEEYDSNAWQFSLSVNEHGRVHGFFIDNTFYVVWLDAGHALYR